MSFTRQNLLRFFHFTWQSYWNLVGGSSVLIRWILPNIVFQSGAAQYAGYNSNHSTKDGRSLMKPNEMHIAYPLKWLHWIHHLNCPTGNSLEKGAQDEQLQKLGKHHRDEILFTLCHMSRTDAADFAHIVRRGKRKWVKPKWITMKIWWRGWEKLF